MNKLIPIIIFSLYSFSISASLITKQTALLTDSQFFKDCDQFTGSDTNIDMQFSCASSNLSLEGQVLGKDEYKKYSKSLYKDTSNSKTAINSQIKDLDALNDLTQNRALLQGASSYAFQISGVMNIDKTTAVVNDYADYNNHIKSMNSSHRSKTSLNFTLPLFNSAIAEELSFVDYSGKELEIEPYIELCSKGIEEIRKRSKHPTMDDACGDLDDREKEVKIGNKTIKNPFDERTGDYKKSCQEDLEEDTAKYLIEQDCQTQTYSDVATCQKQKEKNEMDSYKEEAKDKIITPYDKKEKKCFRALETSFSASKLASTLIGAAIARYLAYEEFLAKQFNDPDHVSDSMKFVKSTITRDYSFGYSILGTEYKPINDLNKSIAETEAEEYAKTFNNLEFIRKSIYSVLGGQKITAFSINKFPHPDNHGLKEGLDENSTLIEENMKVIFCKNDTEGIPNDVYSTKQKGKTVGKHLTNDMQELENFFEPVTRRIRNSLVYMAAYSQGMTDPSNVKIDPIIEELLDPAAQENFEFKKSTDFSMQSIISQLLLNRAVAQTANNITFNMFSNAYSGSLSLKDSFLATPIKRSVQNMAVSDRAHAVESTLYEKMQVIQGNRKKLKNYHDSIDQTTSFLKTKLKSLFSWMFPHAFANTKKKTLKMGCITKNCLSFSSIINQSKDEFTIRPSLNKHVNLFSALVDEINQHKGLTPKAQNLLIQIKKSRNELNSIQNQAENELYQTLQNNNFKSFNFKKSVSVFEMSTRKITGSYLASKGINHKLLEQGLFGKISNRYRKQSLDKSLSQSPPVAQINKIKAQATNKNHISSSASSNTENGPIEGAKDSDIIMDRSTNIFQTISKKYLFIYYLKK